MQEQKTTILQLQRWICILCIVLAPGCYKGDSVRQPAVFASLEDSGVELGYLGVVSCRTISRSGPITREELQRATRETPRQRLLMIMSSPDRHEGGPSHNWSFAVAPPQNVSIRVTLEYNGEELKEQTTTVVRPTIFDARVNSSGQVTISTTVLDQR